MLEFLAEVLVGYVLGCMIWATFYVVRHLDELQENSLTPGCPYYIFAAGIIWLVLSSPYWVTRIIYGLIATLIKEIREIKV